MAQLEAGYIKIRRGTVAQWTASGYILQDGEIGRITDGGADGKPVLVLGDGSTAALSLPQYATLAQVKAALSGVYAQLVDHASTRPSGQVIWTGGTASTPPAGVAGDLWIHN